MNKTNFTILSFAILSILIVFSSQLVVAWVNPARVNLGEAGNFAVLSKVSISSVPGSTITGEVGISPADGTYITGLTCPEVTGSSAFPVHVAASGGANTIACQVVDPAYLTPTIGEMEAAYSDANSRPYDVTLGGSIGGLTLTPGVYFTAISLGIPTDVTLDCTSTGSSGVFIFQIGGNLDLPASTHVNLIGNCQADNIFWAVAGTTTIGGGVGVESTFNGNVLGGPATSEILVVTGSTVNGRLLGQKGIALQSNIITKPVDNTLNLTTIRLLTSNNLSSANITLGDTDQLNATGYNQFNETVNITINYTSSNSSVASVNSTTGLVRAISLGNAIITASNGSVSNIVNITVIAVVVPAAPTPTPTTNSGSSGGGGGSCTTKWNCTDWSVCSNSIQTRTCAYTANWCKPMGVKPTQSQACISDIVNIDEPTSTVVKSPDTINNKPTPTTKPSITGAVTGIMNKGSGMTTTGWIFLVTSIAAIGVAIGLVVKKIIFNRTIGK